MSIEFDIDIDIEPTPNPNALKFILNYPVKNNGSSTYRTPLECEHNPLARELFRIRGVDQLHFFENVISLTKFSYEEWQTIEEKVAKTLKELMPSHNAEYDDPNPKEERRKSLSKELQDIEAILDKTIRPGLQADGGDIETLTYQENILMIKYQGACGTCPSSTTGTLEAIKAILRDEFNPDIDVYIAPEY